MLTLFQPLFMKHKDTCLFLKYLLLKIDYDYDLLTYFSVFAGWQIFP